MAQLTKEELITKISEKVADENIAIELMEDVTDSFSDGTASFDDERAEFEGKLAAAADELAALKQKYKERFLSGSEEKEPESEHEETTEEVVDVKEI